jgi:SAM-dependent methyltransferase
MMSEIARIWWEGIRTGIGAVRREPSLGLKRLVLPVSYWRSVEFAYVWRQLRNPPGARVLDVGSPKGLALSLARSRGYEMVATDILGSAVSESDRFATAVGRSGRGPGLVLSEIQDGRSLSYEDASFDAAFSVSVLEHIPDDGDTTTIRELVRVVRPGGLIIVTTPYDLRHRDTYVSDAVYERGFKGLPVFFERHYDRDSLNSRLIAASQAPAVSLELWGERSLRGERFLSGAGKMRAVLSPLEAVLASVCLRREGVEGSIHPMAAFFTLQRPEKM